MGDERSEREYWDDIMGSQQGIFGNDAPSVAGNSAMTEFANARAVPTPEGLAISLQCERDGRPQTVVAEYPELIAIKYGISPHIAYGQAVAQGHKIPYLNGPATQWGYDPNMKRWFPNAACRCGAPIQPRISVAEAESALRAAQAAPWIEVAIVTQLSNFCAKMAGR